MFIIKKIKKIMKSLLWGGGGGGGGCVCNVYKELDSFLKLGLKVFEFEKIF